MLIPTTPESLEMQRVRAIVNCIQQEQVEAHRRSRMANAVAFATLTNLMSRQLSR